MSQRFIAEVSSNHHKDLSRCLAFVNAAAGIGCSGVKFQLFRIGELFAPEAIDANPALRERIEWELPTEFLGPIAERSRDRGLDFLCTPFYLDAVAELEPYVDAYKIASYELLWDDLLIACARTGKPLLLSTGMATLEEVDHAAEVIRDAGCTDLTLLHCVSDYPAKAGDANLAAIDTLRERFGCEVGWSDHSVDPAVIYRAVHRWGASLIEFHLDLDAKGAEYASGHCWLPDEIRLVIETVSSGFGADGTGVKAPAESETVERSWRADPTDGLRPLRETREDL